jgi:hypothetical protein
MAPVEQEGARARVVELLGDELVVELLEGGSCLAATRAPILGARRVAVGDIVVVDVASPRPQVVFVLPREPSSLREAMIRAGVLRPFVPGAPTPAQWVNRPTLRLDRLGREAAKRPVAPHLLDDWNRDLVAR